MNGAEGASGLDQLHQIVVAGEKPLGTKGARESRFKGERGASLFIVMYQYTDD